MSKPPSNRTKQARNAARSARKTPSVAEVRFWKELRARNLRFKFRREHPMLQYRLDFYCPEVRLAVELDGEQHDPTRDALRDEALAALGIEVYRIPNRVYFSLDGPCFTDFLDEIVKRCEERLSGENAPHPNPSPRKRGEGPG